MRILISRPDGIGDNVLTLPLAGAIKEKYPEAHISYITSAYAEPLVSLCRHVDNVIIAEELLQLPPHVQIELIRELEADAIIHVFPRKDIAKLSYKAKVPVRIGSSHRWYNLIYCNRRINFSRKKSELHEAQLNFKLAEPLGLHIPELNDIPILYGLEPPECHNPHLELLQNDKINIILHPKSKGHGVEWSLDNFGRLIKLLPEDKYRLFVSGSSSEKAVLEDFLAAHKNKVIDICGKMPLQDFVAFISKSDALIASSTGPIHIAAAMGKAAIGIFPPIRPIHPGRWAPLGFKAKALVIDKDCKSCPGGAGCECINKITPEEVLKALEEQVQ